MESIPTVSPTRAIIQLSIPIVISNFVVQLHLLIENMLIGWTLGVEVLAGFTAATTIFYMFSNFSLGLILGLTIHLANAFGSGDYHRLKRSVFINYFFIILITSIATFIGLFFLDDLLRMINIADESYQSAYNFLSIQFWGFFVHALFMHFTYIFRALGDNRTPFYFLITVSIINIIFILIALLIFNLGIQGVAYAYLFANLIGLSLCLYSVFTRWSILHINLRERDFVLSEFTTHIKSALPIALQSIIISIGGIFVQRSLNAIGANAVSAQGIGARIDMFCVIFLNAIGLAIATYTAQNYGAKQYKRILQGVRAAITISLVITLVFSLIFFFQGKNIFQFVSGAVPNSEVVYFGSRYFLLHVPFYWSLGLLLIFRNALQGMGLTLFPSLAGITEVLMRIFAAVVLFNLLGFDGVTLGDGLAWFGAAVVVWINYVKVKRKLVAQIDVS